MRPKTGGTVRKVRNRKTGEIAGYQALLPEALSTRPSRSTDVRYREPVGPLLPTEAAAQRVLELAVAKISKVGELRHGLPFSEYVAEEIEQRRLKARRDGLSVAQANIAVSTWRSIVRRWLSLPKCSFYTMPPDRIAVADLQHWFDQVLGKALRNGEPLSGNFIQNVAALIRAGFARAQVVPNPAASLTLPSKNKPKVPHLGLREQHAFFKCDGIELSDRIMVGCGMGAGLRVNELLSMEPGDVHLDGANPHLIVRYGGAGRAKTKSRKTRRVELFEPGLGFWRLHMAGLAQDATGVSRGVRGSYPAGVFRGPNNGYLKNWPEQFQAWAERAGLEAMTSHYMRHSYAVSMLSGLWGYEPRSLEWCQSQLGHSDIQTTERYYGHVLSGTWAREARLMTGAKHDEPRAVITAANLLGGRTYSGLAGGGNSGGFAVGRPQNFSKEVASFGQSPSLTQTSINLEKKASKEAKWWVNPPIEPGGSEFGDSEAELSAESGLAADPSLDALAQTFADAIERAGVAKRVARELYRRACAVSAPVQIEAPSGSAEESA